MTKMNVQKYQAASKTETFHQTETNLAEGLKTNLQSSQAGIHEATFLLCPKRCAVYQQCNS